MTDKQSYGISCETCKYYVPHKTFKEDPGNCHRYPPNNSGSFPMVHKSTWCGEWKSKKRYEPWTEKFIEDILP